MYQYFFDSYIPPGTLVPLPPCSASCSSVNTYGSKSLKNSSSFNIIFFIPDDMMTCTITLLLHFSAIAATLPCIMNRE